MEKLSERRDGVISAEQYEKIGERVRALLSDVFNDPKIQSFQKEIHDKGLTGKKPSEISSDNNGLLHRIYRYAKVENIRLSELFLGLGANLSRIDGLDTIDKLDRFMDFMFYKDNNWNSIPLSHKNIIKKYIEKNGLNFNSFCSRYGILYIDDFRVYKTIDDIKQDITEKGLLGTSIQQIMDYDNNKTYSNIHKFISREENTSLQDIRFALHIQYDEKFIVVDGMPKVDYVYKKVEDMIGDIHDKGLVGKTIKDLKKYDKGLTHARMRQLASRLDCSINNLYVLVGITYSNREPVGIKFETLDDIKTYVKDNGLVGKTIKEVRESKFYKAVSQYCEYLKRKKIKISMKDIRHEVGIVRESGFYNVDEIIQKISDNGYSSSKDIRTKDSRFYGQISSFCVNSKISIKSIRQKAGFNVSSVGRPSSNKDTSSHSK